MPTLHPVLFILLLLGLLGPVGAAHITDKLVVGIYADPGLEGSPTKLLSSGTPLEVLQNKGDLVQVRLADDIQGWIESRYVTEEKPAKAMLLETQTRLRAVNMELQALKSNREAVGSPVPAPKQAPSAREAQLRQALTAAESRIAELERQLQQQPLDAEARQQLNTLQGKVNVALKMLAEARGLELREAEPAAEQGWFDRHRIWLIALGTALLGFGVGVALIDYRIRKRYGGFRI